MKTLHAKYQGRLLAHSQVARTLRERITAGDYSATDFLPAERDLAEELHVSRQTVRQAIEILRQENIVVPEQGRGTRIVALSDLKMTSAEQTSFQLAALIIYGIARESSAAICQGCTAVMRQADYHLIVAETTLAAQQRATDEAAHLHALIDRGIQGIIIYAEPTSQNRRLLQQALKRNVQIVQIDRYLSELPYDYVGVDNESAAFSMTQHLIQRGHQRIAFLSLEPEASTSRERREGYFGAMQTSEATRSNALVGRIESEKCLTTEIEYVLAQWLALPEPPTAIFAVNDELALALMQVLKSQGVKVPSKMAVVGFDNLRTTGFCSPALTTIEQPFVELGATAARLLLERMSGRAEKRPQRVLLPTKLIVRQSCVLGEETRLLAKAS